MVFRIEQAIQTRRVGLSEALGDNAERFKGLVMKALPDLSLPEAVEIFDGGLEAGFQWRGKDRRDVEGKTKAHHSSDHIGVVVPALEADIIIKLGKGRQSVFAPKQFQRS
jgi:hypothetical protein